VEYLRIYPFHDRFMPSLAYAGETHQDDTRAERVPPEGADAFVKSWQAILSRIGENSSQLVEVASK